MALTRVFRESLRSCAYYSNKPASKAGLKKPVGCKLDLVLFHFRWAGLSTGTSLQHLVMLGHYSTAAAGGYVQEGAKVFSKCVENITDQIPADRKGALHMHRSGHRDAGILLRALGNRALSAVGRLICGKAKAGAHTRACGMS